MKLGMEVGRSPGHIVSDGDTAPTKGHSPIPQFSAHVHCGQTAGWMKMPLSMKVGLSLCDFVLDGTQLPPKGGTYSSLQFSAYGYLSKRLDASGSTCYGGAPRPMATLC